MFYRTDARIVYDGAIFERRTRIIVLVAEADRRSRHEDRKRGRRE